MSGSDDQAEDGRTIKLRKFFARYVVSVAASDDPRIEDAFATVPRAPFAGPGPWSIPFHSPWRPASGLRKYLQTPDDDPAFLYQNVLIALDAAWGINIGEPSLHAHCLDALSPQAGEVVVHVGAGSGYYTAILAHLVGPQGRVHGFEVDPDLAGRAARNLVPWPQATLHARSGAADGLPSADAVYVSAGTTQPERAWLDALRPGGRLLFPLQPEGGFGGMLLVQRPRDGGLAWPARFVSRAGFIPCQARQDDEAGRGLAAAFAGGGWDAVQTIRFGGTPDDTCWFNGGGWWLSTAPA